MQNISLHQSDKHLCYMINLGSMEEQHGIPKMEKKYRASTHQIYSRNIITERGKMQVSAMQPKPESEPQHTHLRVVLLQVFWKINSHYISTYLTLHIQNAF